MLTETLLKIPLSVIGRFSLVPAFHSLKGKCAKITYHRRLPVWFYRITGSFLYAFSVSKSLLYGLWSVQLEGFLKLVRFGQSCKWNERSLNRGLNRGRGLGSDETFFWDSCSNHEIDENFQISHKLGHGLAAKISQAFAIQLVCYRGQYTPRLNSPPP